MKKEEIEILERQGCFSSDWSKVEIAEGTDLSRIRNVYFSGPVRIGRGTEIINVPGGISNVRIGDNVRIINVARIENSTGATFGVGTDVAVLDEAGGHQVRIYPGVSSQIAAIAARMPEYTEEKLLKMTDRHIADLPDRLEIGNRAEIRDCGPITDVRVWGGAFIEGAARLHNGSIVNDPRSRGAVYVGQGVDAENFIIEDATVSGGSILRNTYVGQGCVIDKGFTSHDSLFFANCSMENGEACAVLAGPYTVSMHKSSLLIGCQTAFFNAGSGTNMSNHMYKLGPVHWGVLERGVKTSSNSYLMHGTRIGPFSLIMGEHKTHPDTSDFPFSYLFGDKEGKTTVVPGAMLKSYGLKRDAEKWPKRDRRIGQNIRLIDRITYSILNPHTVGLILDAIELTDRLLKESPEDVEVVIYKGLNIKRSSLEKGKRMYELAICKYLQILNDNESSAIPIDICGASEKWIDLLGLVISESDFRKALKADSIQEMEAIFDKAAATRAIDARLATFQNDFAQGAAEFDAIVEKDRLDSIDQLVRENNMMAYQ